MIVKASFNKKQIMNQLFLCICTKNLTIINPMQLHKNNKIYILFSSNINNRFFLKKMLHGLIYNYSYSKFLILP
jgi:hypothetical protein